MRLNHPNANLRSVSHFAQRGAIALIRFFLAQAKREFNKPDLEGLAPETVERLTAFDWPGNVRQLRAVIRRCVLDTVMPVITPDILPTAIAGRSETVADSSDGVRPRTGEDGSELPQLVRRLLCERSTNVYAESMEYMERFVILKVLQQTDGNQSQAAEILGITRGKLRDRINAYNISLKSDVSVDQS